MQRAVQIQTGICEACGLIIACAFIAFDCKIHFICLGCTKTMPGLVPDWTDKGRMCPYCKMEDAVYIKETVFTKPHVENSVRGLMYKNSLKATNYYASCWLSTDESKMFLGGYPGITVLHDDGRELVYKLPCDSAVCSGVAITDEKHLIIIDGISVIIVNIFPPESELHSVNTLNVNNPRRVFAITKHKYGVMCEDKRIEFFSLRNVLMDCNPSHTGFMNIDVPNRHIGDTVCSLPDDTICVASCHDHLIYQYDNDGHRLAVIGQSRDYDSPVRPGHLHLPKSLQSCGDTLVVSCVDGDVHTYQDGVWKLLMTKGKTGGVLDVFRRENKIYHSVCSESKFWVIGTGYLRKVHVYDVSHD